MKRGIIAGACALALLVTACGSSGGSEKTIAKADYVKQANAICAAASTDLDKVSSKIGADATEADLEKFLTDDLVPNVKGQIDKLRDLGYPEGDKATLSGILDDADQVLDDISKDPATYIKNVDKDPFVEVNKGFSAYGLTDCGSTDS